MGLFKPANEKIANNLAEIAAMHQIMMRDTSPLSGLDRTNFSIKAMKAIDKKLTKAVSQKRKGKEIASEFLQLADEMTQKGPMSEDQSIEFCSKVIDAANKHTTKPKFH